MFRDLPGHLVVVLSIWIIGFVQVAPGAFDSLLSAKLALELTVVAAVVGVYLFAVGLVLWASFITGYNIGFCAAATLAFLRDRIGAKLLAETLLVSVH